MTNRLTERKLHEILHAVHQLVTHYDVVNGVGNSCQPAVLFDNVPTRYQLVPCMNVIHKLSVSRFVLVLVLAGAVMT